MHQPQQADRIHIPDARQVRIVPDAHRVAGQRQDVADAQRVRAQQVGLQRHEVAVARGEVDDGLQVQVVAHQAGEGEAAHAHARHRAIGDVDEADAVLLEPGSAVEYLARIESLRRIQLDTDDELPGLQRVLQPCLRSVERTRCARRSDDAGAVLRGRFERGDPGDGPDGEAILRQESARAACIALMCAGVVPQQPPIRRTPALAKRRA